MLCWSVGVSKPGFSDCSRRASSFLAFRFRHSFLLVLIPVLLGRNSDPVRPGDEWFKKLSNGVKGPLPRGSCHQTSDRQYRSHAYRRAPGASRISALACRIESWIRLTKSGNSRQVSGTSDASKDAVRAYQELRKIGFAGSSHFPVDRGIIG